MESQAATHHHLPHSADLTSLVTVAVAVADGWYWSGSVQQKLSPGSLFRRNFAGVGVARGD